MDELAEQFAKEHIQKSKEDISSEDSAEKIRHWENGERAKEQARSLVETIVLEAKKRILNKENKHETQ